MRLTNSDRDQVRDKAINFAFEARKKELQNEENELGLACYRSLFPIKTRKAAEAMPENWLRSDSCLRFSIRGMNVVLNLTNPVPVPHSFNCHRLGEVSDDTLFDRFQALEGAREDFKRAKTEAFNSVGALLYRAGTLKSLKESWPEGERFYAHLTPRESASLPAIQIEVINSMLGLAKAA